MSEQQVYVLSLRDVDSGEIINLESNRDGEVIVPTGTYEPLALGSSNVSSSSIRYCALWPQEEQGTLNSTLP